MNVLFVKKSGEQTDPNEIPTARKSHFGNGVWLPHHAAVLAFELRERYRLCARMVLVAGEVATSLVRVKDPKLRQVRQVGQLYAWCDHLNCEYAGGQLVGLRTGLPSVQSSQSRIPITRFSVGWKMRLSSL